MVGVASIAATTGHPLRYRAAMTTGLFPHRIPDRAMQPTVRGGRLRPLGRRILVRPDPEDERTGFGLHLPVTAQDQRRAQTGTVVAVGPEVLDLRPGDRVLYRQWGGIEVTVAGVLHVLLRTRQAADDPADVFAVLD